MSLWVFRVSASININILSNINLSDMRQCIFFCLSQQNVVVMVTSRVTSVDIIYKVTKIFVLSNRCDLHHMKILFSNFALFATYKYKSKDQKNRSYKILTFNIIFSLKVSWNRLFQKKRFTPNVKNIKFSNWPPLDFQSTLSWPPLEFFIVLHWLPWKSNCLSF